MGRNVTSKCDNMFIVMEPILATLHEGVAQLGANCTLWPEYFAPCQLSEMGVGDILVVVGPALAALMPWAQLRQTGVHRVYYDTDPMTPSLYQTDTGGQPTASSAQVLESKLWWWAKSPVTVDTVLDAEEIWHYTHANKAVVELACAGRNITNRFVPPGNHGWKGGNNYQMTNLGKGLLFVGDVSGKNAARVPCWQALQRALSMSARRLNRSSALLYAEVVDHALDKLQHLNHRIANSGLTHLSMHKQCTSELADMLPLETVRLAKALSLGRIVVSQRANQADEAEYAGIVTFVGERTSSQLITPSRLAIAISTDDEDRAHMRAQAFALAVTAEAEQLTALNKSERSHLRMSRAAAFKARFAPAAILGRAGLPGLLCVSSTALL